MPAIVLGGGTREGFLSDAILQVLAVPLLIVSLWALSTRPDTPFSRAELIFCSALVIVPAFQLIPLPPAVWTRLPGMDAVASSLNVLGNLPWRPISVAPDATWQSLLSLVVPISIFLGVGLLGYRDRRVLSLILISMGVVSVFLGLSQVAQGPSSSLRLFDFSNSEEAVGFFANRNHFAALLYASMLLAVAWMVEATLGEMPGRKRFDTIRIVLPLACFTCLVVLIGAQAMARSRAGLGLAILGIIGGILIGVADSRKPSSVTPVKLLAAALGLALIFATQFALYRVMERFATDPLQDARLTFARKTFEAARSLMPFGSGMGSFVPVYARFEEPADILANTYANRAHNDFLELWLEAGVPALLLMAAFLGWLVVRTLSAWRGTPGYAKEVDAGLARASSIVLWLLVAHSLMDYPLRTEAMMAVFAFCCALLVAPLSTETRVAVEAEEAAFEPAAAAFEAYAPTPSTEKWGKEREWPDAWRKPPQR